MGFSTPSDRPRLDRSAYAYLTALSLSGCAWEFLRRNLDYQRDWRLHRTVTPRSLQSVEGLEFRMLHRRFPGAEVWGLRAFEDPAFDGRVARLFWLPDVQPRWVSASASRALSPPAARLSMSQIAGVRSLLVGVNGATHLAIEGGRDALGLRIADLDRPVGHFGLVFEIPAFDALKRRCEAMAEIEWRSAVGYPRSKRADALMRAKLGSCLMAIDGRRLGLSYRAIAEATFGEKSVAEDWAGPGRFLKDRTRRLVDKGLALTNGGYRGLLR